jgi:uncharacterized protein YjbI with pentapeptide repeats
MRDCDLSHADFRLADMRGADICSSNVRRADFRGARIGGLNVQNADLSHSYFSDPAFFDLNLYEAKSLVESVYTAMGQEDYLVEEYLFGRDKAV